MRGSFHTDRILAGVEGLFDLIVCSEVLEHVVEPRQLVAEIQRKLAPGGLVFITIPNGYGPREIGGRFEEFLRHRCGLERLFSALRRMLRRVGMPSPEEKYEMHTSNPEQRHVQRFTRRGIVNLLKAEGFEVSEWWNTFVILSVFRCRSGVSLVERLDSWAADHLPPACASGWFLTVARRDDSAAIAGGVSLGSVREG